MNDLQELIEKRIQAILGRAAGDPSLSWSGSVTMPAESFQDFVKTSEDISRLIKNCARLGTLVVFGGDSYKIPTIGLADRQLQKATAHTEPTTIPAFSTGKAEIIPTEVILPINIPYETLEDAVGKAVGEVGEAGLNAKVDQAIGDLSMGAVANDLEDLILNGDTASGTPFLQTFDGAIKLVAATGTHYNPGVAQTPIEFLRGLWASAPARIRRGTDNCFCVSPELLSELWEAYAIRNTVGGDAALTQDQQNTLRFRGVPIMELASMPTAKAFFGKQNAFWVGFKRQVTVERQRKPRARVIEYTLTARVGHTEVLPSLLLGTWTQ